MKVAVLSDIHSNQIAFNLALLDIKKERPDKIIFLGDYITDGPNPNEVLSLVKLYGDEVILGNREEYMFQIDKSREGFLNYKPLVSTYDALSEENLTYIKNIPHEKLIELGGCKVLLIHGNGYFSQYKSLEEKFDSCRLLMSKYDFDLCLFGHTHIEEDFIFDGIRFVNPGSLGIPCGDAYYKYCLLDIDDEKIDVRMRKFSTKDTLRELRKNLELSGYYQINKIWCEINLKMIETGIDYCNIFLKKVDRLLCGREVLEEEFNQIWMEAFLELESSKWEV